MTTKKKKFKKHFRLYFRSNHPAFIIDEEKNKKNEDDNFIFRRVTSSEFSGHHRNEKVYPNPDKTKKTPMFIVKRLERDKKSRFSKWKYPWDYQ